MSSADLFPGASVECLVFGQWRRGCVRHITVKGTMCVRFDYEIPDDDGDGVSVHKAFLHYDLKNRSSWRLRGSRASARLKLRKPKTPPASSGTVKPQPWYQPWYVSRELSKVARRRARRRARRSESKAVRTKQESVESTFSGLFGGIEVSDALSYFNHQDEIVSLAENLFKEW